MRIFAAIERILLDRWRKIKIALKVNKWPLLNIHEQRLQLKKQYLESLFRKKWHNFVCPIYVCRWSQFPHMGLAILQRSSLIESDDSPESQSNKDVHMCHTARLVKCGLPFTLIPQHGRNMRLLQCVAICWHLSLSPVSISIRLRLTIMCDSNKMCGNAEILHHSQDNTAIIVV